MRSEYSKWFWSECDELNKDTSFAHSLAEKAWNYRQTEVEELQKRVDAAIYLLTSIKAENDLWGCDQVERQIELLEQALKGGEA